MLGGGFWEVLVAAEYTEWEDCGLDVLEWGVIGEKAEPTGQNWWCYSGSGFIGMVKGRILHDISFITLLLGYSLFYFNQDRVLLCSPGCP